MPFVSAVDGVKLFYEETGSGAPLIFVHEFAGDAESWRLQIGFFSRRYRAIAFNARGYPPSDVPEDPAAYSQAQAVADIVAVLDGLRIARAHVCGLSMGGYSALHFGLDHPDRALSITVAGCGYGSGPADREKFRRDVQDVVAQFDAGWEEFHRRLAAGSAQGHALTMRGVQMTRPSVFDLGERLEQLRVPTLVMTGDEDDPCLEPALFMKRKIASAGLLVLPRSGHAINLEEPEAFNRGLLDFLTAVDAGRWPLRNPASLTGSAILPTK
jgi:pimeloyl-ACP methyl ester carboxylesterase